MNNSEKIKNIFAKTNSILKPLWLDYGAEHTENNQVSHVLYYLSLTAGYLKSKEEAKVFQDEWEKIKNDIKEGSSKFDWLNQGNIIKSHLEQALLEESIHHPNDNRNLGISYFYENIFPNLYESAKKEYENFQKKKNETLEKMRKHHEEIFSTQEKWEAALRRGDPMALVD